MEFWKLPKKIPKKHWNDFENHRRFFIWLGKELGYNELDDWYNITQVVINKNGGEYLLSKYYENSPSKVSESFFA
jgi:hypothetical protein